MPRANHAACQANTAVHLRRKFAFIGNLHPPFLSLMFYFLYKQDILCA